MNEWMMEMYQMQMDWNIETNEWRKMDFSWKSSEGKHRENDMPRNKNSVAAWKT